LQTKIKICGIKTPEALDAAIAGGASHVGLVFFNKSPRDISAEAAGALAARAAGRAKVVGLFVDAESAFIDAVRQHAKLEIIQLHGDELPAEVNMVRQRNGLETWKVIPIRSSADFAATQKYSGSADMVLYDAKAPKGADLPGGNGMRFDWTLLQGTSHPLPWGLAGGLAPDNIADAIQISGAPLVDVSSGVESAPGIKDVAKIAAFCQAVRDYDHS
jgi:phosphoribosylanthranilate isomerase